MAITESSYSPPPLSDILGDIRTSKMKQMPNLTIYTGIMKDVRAGRIPVSTLGLEQDEHDPTFHGGPDKAIHHYDSSHYANWSTQYPSSAHLFKPGGFGENLSTSKLNEKNVCIGDIWSVGSEVLLQVSLPRQPCFKLNHRFQIRNFAPQTIKKKATGWYYRVLRGGSIAAGDEMHLVERKYPAWTIERIQHFAHHEKNNLDALTALASIEEMGDEAKGMFTSRLKEQQRVQSAPAAITEKWVDFRVVEKRLETARVAAFVLERVIPFPEDAEKPSVGGAFVKLRLPNSLERCYSIVEGTAEKFTLGVALDAASRGGSAWLHSHISEGMVLPVSLPTVSWTPNSMASKHIFIAGGIGITAFTYFTPLMAQIHLDLELHYAVRSAADVPFRAVLEKLGPAVHIYDATQGQRLDVRAVLSNRPWNSHVYVCGPKRLLDAVRETAKELDVPDREIHYEAFQVDNTDGDPFDVVVRRAPASTIVGMTDGRDAASNKNCNTTPTPESPHATSTTEEAVKKEATLHVPADKTLLSVLREAGFDIPSSCEVGSCGTCNVEVCEGTVERRGAASIALDNEDDELEKGRMTMRTCVDRGVGRIVVEVDVD